MTDDRTGDVVREGVIPEEFQDRARGERIQKVLADAGVASRRACEKLITEGQIRVNRKLVTGLPAFIDPEHDVVSVDGRKIQLQRAGQQRTCVLLHKPRRVISTASDPQGRRQVVDMVELPGKPRLYPVGRLDADSTGLMLLTNDGLLAQALTHPRYEVEKEYEVLVDGSVTEEDAAKLTRGLMLTRDQPDAAPRHEVKRAKVQQVRVLGQSRLGRSGRQTVRTRLSVVLREGQNREIRRLLASLGFKVRRLIRTRVGSLRLRGLGPGDWRLLTQAEINRLRSDAGLPRTDARPAAAGRKRPGARHADLPARAHGWVASKPPASTDDAPGDEAQGYDAPDAPDAPPADEARGAERGWDASSDPPPSQPSEDA